MLTDPSPPPSPTAHRPPGLALAVAAGLTDDLIVATNDLERLQRLIDDAAASLLTHFNGAATELQSLARAAAPVERALAHVSGAIAAMQFQDMATQLLAHTQRRLRHCADRLSQEPRDGTVAPTRPNPVTQDEMDAGSIELF